jgi:hypothetical protein
MRLFWREPAVFEFGRRDGSVSLCEQREAAAHHETGEDCWKCEFQVPLSWDGCGFGTVKVKIPSRWSEYLEWNSSRDFAGEAWTERENGITDPTRRSEG